MRTVSCPKCQVELTIPDDAGSRRLRCPKCAERFYPSGRPASSTGAASSRGAESSLLLESIDQSKAVKRVTVPPSSGQHPATRASGGDLRDFLDIPLADDGPVARPSGRSAAAADASALFRDDLGPPKSRPMAAENRLHARRCTSCQSVVPAGLSLCDHCGLDQDTGQRYDVEEEYVDDAPMPTAASGPPAMVLMIGLIALVCSALLALMALIQLDGIGRLCLFPVSLFGVYAAVEFLRGKHIKLLVVALMLGGAVDILAFIVLPAIVSQVGERLDAPLAQDDAPPPPRSADPEAETPVASSQVDIERLTIGIVVLFIDAAMLLSMTAPSVRHHFERKRRSRDEGFVIP